MEEASEQINNNGRAEAVAQLVELSLPSPKVRGLNLISSILGQVLASIFCYSNQTHSTFSFGTKYYLFFKFVFSDWVGLEPVTADCKLCRRPYNHNPRNHSFPRAYNMFFVHRWHGWYYIIIIIDTTKRLWITRLFCLAPFFYHFIPKGIKKPSQYYFCRWRESNPGSLWAAKWAHNPIASRHQGAILKQFEAGWKENYWRSRESNVK